MILIDLYSWALTQLGFKQVVDLSSLDKGEDNCYTKLVNDIKSGRVEELEIALQKLTNQNAISERGLTEKYC